MDAGLALHPDKALALTPTPTLALTLTLTLSACMEQSRQVADDQQQPYLRPPRATHSPPPHTAGLLRRARPRQNPTPNPHPIPHPNQAYYGGRDEVARHRNIVWSNGALDPWSGQGV